jgi:hypothetical protein
MPESKPPRGRDLDRNPETGQPEDHPLGIAGGALTGGAAGGVAGAAIAGAATGTIAGGPLGAVVGAAVGVVAGSVIGGIAGKAIAERVDPAHEDAYWRGEYLQRPYAASEWGWEDYGPAYRYGYWSYEEFDGRPFEEIEPELAREWDAERGQSRLDWADAREAARDAYDRLASGRDRRDEIPTRQ